MDDDAILAIATPLIKGFEGFRSRPYPDSRGVPTIGYGTTYYTNGTRVTLADAAITEPQAAQMLSNKIAQEFLPGVKRLFNESDAINSNQYAALLSFEYNEGVGALASSTLARKLIAGDVVGASNEFPHWDTAGGVFVQGLLNRRLKEQALFNTPV